MSVAVRLRVAPLEGGAIVSLVANAEEWLVQGPPRPAPGDDSVSFTSSPPRGWDEMMPTIDACRMGDYDVPDHGEAWRHPWVDGGGDILRFTSDRGYVLEREMVQERGGMRLHYTVTSESRIPFLWAAHPLFKAPAGSRAEIDVAVTQAYEVSPRGAVLVPFDPSLLEIDSLRTGEYRKVVFPPSSAISKARVIHPDGSWIALEWDASSVPYLAVYLERQAFTDEDCIAIEPMTGWYDDLSQAVARGLCAWVDPSEPRRWDLFVSSGRSDQMPDSTEQRAQGETPDD